MRTNNEILLKALLQKKLSSTGSMLLVLLDVILRTEKKLSEDDARPDSMLVVWDMGEVVRNLLDAEIDKEE